MAEAAKRRDGRGTLPLPEDGLVERERADGLRRCLEKLTTEAAVPVLRRLVGGERSRRGLCPVRHHRRPGLQAVPQGEGAVARVLGARDGMKVCCAGDPDEPAEFIGWLDRHLVGPDLAALVAELEAVHGADAVLGRFGDQVLGDHGDAVMIRGLSALPREGSGRSLPTSLVARPARTVLASGGEHWQRLMGFATSKGPSSGGGGGLPPSLGLGRPL